MDGKTLTHYRNLELVGGGGMGVVYVAEDVRLKRPVALKFLPPELTRDPESRDRFVQEAQTASALDHPNICTIYEIDSTADGQLFIAMAYYRGATLKKRTERPLPLPEAIDLAAQIAKGLSKAHEAGIIHRDIKPANVMVTSDGVAKIVDFGIAKLSGHTGATRTGLTLGTVAYMSPEQIEHGVADAQSDVWALGLVFYEMLAGQRAFPGETNVTIINAVLNHEPKPLTEVRPDVPPEIVRIVGRAIAKPREVRYRSAADFLHDLTEFQQSSAGSHRNALQQTSNKRVVGAVAAASVLFALGTPAAGLWWWQKTQEHTWARAEGIPEIRRLIEQESYAAAAAVATRVETILPGDSVVATLWKEIAADVTIESTPTGAQVAVKEYADVEGGYRILGRTPLNAVRLPRGIKRWRVTADGFAVVEHAAPPGKLTFALAKLGSIPDDMVPIPGGTTSAWIAGMDPIEGMPLAGYLIDRYEVTNKQFKAFVDAGGYARRELWKHAFVHEGRPLSFDEAMLRFRDQTGRAGPSTWELGNYVRGRDNAPVSGVSWYEAAAYAEFAGKSLPTVYHWVEAASTRMPSQIVPLSNFSGKGPGDAGTYQGMSEYGVYDMAGNVREWLWNASGSDRHMLGGAWNDQVYMFSYASTRDPFNRSAENGFRCVRYLNGMPAATGAPVALSHRDYSRERPVADAVFQAYLNQFSYDPLPLEARIESKTETADWTQETVTFAAAYGGERMTAHVRLPKVGKPPFQIVVTFPGSNVIFQKRSPGAVPEYFDYLSRSGRAVVFPVYKGTFERNDGMTSTWPSPTHRHSEYVVKQVKDFKRTLDYLQTRPEFDSTKVAYLGFSWGGRLGAIVPAVDRRVKLNLLVLGGLAAGRALPEVDQINYISRVTVPVLMINGRYDAIEPLESAQLPMLRMWGTPAADRKHVIFDTGHGPFPQHALVKELLDWVDRYFGASN